MLLWLKQPKHAQKTADGTAEMYFSVILYKKKSSGARELAAPPQVHLIRLFQVLPKSNTELVTEQIQQH